MFVERLQKDNPKFVAAMVKLQQEGALLPDSYAVDMEQFRANAAAIVASAKEKGIKLYFMLKQIGRNPVLAQELMKLGYVESIQEAFKRLLSPKHGYYTPPRRHTPSEMLGIVRDLGAVSVLAHPYLNLTQQQLIDIYTGNVTNWNEVGGEDLEIIPYQRVATSGSQSLFMKLLMKDIVPMDAPMELRPAEMGMLIDELARYNNEGNALGYSVFYYASYMYQQPGLKMIAVDGVQPSDETIADGSYPLLNEYYLVIRADEPEDSPARQLRNWILTDEGRAAIIEAGYIPMPKE